LPTEENLFTNAEVN